MEWSFFTKILAMEIKMNNNCCSAEDIFRLNNSKEYVLLSQQILELVVTDHRLHAQAAKLWQFLYSKAKFDQQLAITVSYPELANIFGKSVRTIARYVANLVEQGYLAIDANFANSGSRLANTLFVRIPTNSLESIYACKDRQGRSAEKPTAVKTYDKIVSSSPDNSVITNNNIKTNTNNNTEIVVALSLQPIKKENVFHVEQSVLETEQDLEKDNQLTDIQLQIDQLGTHCKILNERFKSSTSENQLKLLPQLTQLEGRKQALELFYTQQLRCLQKTRAVEKQKHCLNQEMNFISEKTKERSFNQFEIHRLKQGLHSFCSIETIPRLLNEITYAIRFGDLRVKQSNNEVLSIHHAISIALKLVREGRWETPRGIDKGKTKG